MSKALIIIDMQNDYYPDGAMALEGVSAASAKCQQLLQHFRANQGLVFHVQHVAVQPGATFFLPHSKGCEIHPDLTPLPHEAVILKHYPNAFRETGLLAALHANGVTDLVVCGAMTHMCIDTTVRAAFDLGYRCQLVSDACATCDLTLEGQVVPAAQVQAAFLAALQNPFASLISTEALLAA